MIRPVMSLLIMIFSGCCLGAPLSVVVVEGSVTFHGESIAMGSAFRMSDGDKIALNSASVCATDSHNQTACVSKDRSSISHQQFIQEIENRKPGLVSLLFGKIFTYSSESFQGGKRLDDKVALPDFPSGSILKPRSALLLNLADSAENQYRDFELLQEGKTTPVMRIKAPSSTIRIPAETLQYGTEYHWRITKNGELFQGAFVIAYREDQLAFREEVEATPGYSELPPNTKLLIEAVKAKEWQYLYDMHELTQQLSEARGTGG